MSTVAGVDVGATHTRALVLEEDGRHVPGTPLLTARHCTARALLEAALGGARPDAVCVAVAGPVLDGAARLTHGTLRFEATALRDALAVPALVLANDVAALATEVAGRAAGAPGFQQLGSVGWANGPRAVLAPGTGLGVALIDADGRVWPSEGGHAPLAPADALERELLGVLAESLGYVSWESVLSGPGLVHLHRAMCRVWGGAAEALTAEQVTERAKAVTCPICHQTLETWCAMLGNAAGALCVTAAASGGVYLGGGIPPRLGDFIAAGPFRRRFEERGPLSDFARGVPTAIIMDELAGAAGAARCAGRLLAAGGA